MAATAPAQGTSIDALLLDAADRHSARSALVYEDEEIGYGDLGARAERLAGRMLQAAGGTELAGLRVVVIAGNAPALPVALLAAWRVGAVAVPLSGRLRDQDLGAALADAGPALVLTVESHLGYSFVELLRGLLPGLSTLRAVLVLDALGEARDVLHGRAGGDDDRLGPEVAALLYTSGTTGVPKGALVTHGREVAAALYLPGLLRLDAADRVVLVVPVAHAFGLTCLLATLVTGACAILVESTFSPRAVLEALRVRRATVLHGSPALFHSVLKARPAGLAPVRTGFVAGASSPPGLLEQLDGTGTCILNLYGLTEAGAVSCCRPDDAPEVRHAGAGLPLPGFAVRVGDGQPGFPLGELLIRGPAVTPGYHRRPEETEAAFADGWFRTGDLAEIAGGRVRISGRARELVHVAGFNVFPAEVEGALLAHPDVAQAAVVGVPDEQMGERLCAFVVPRPGAEPEPPELLRFVRGRLAGYKLPYTIHVRPELPTLASGKPDRRALAASATPSAGDAAGRDAAGR